MGRSSWGVGDLHEMQLMGGLFLHCSIALDPLYPSRCSWETFGYATSTSMALASDGLSPLQLSGQLNSLPCSLTFRQEETISIIRLIEQVGAQTGARGRRTGPLGAACGEELQQNTSGPLASLSALEETPPGS